MKNISGLIFLTLLLSHFLTLCLYARSFNVLGTRPLGMGGAFVAVADDALAPHWNPAALGLQKGFDLQIPFNANLEATGNILHSAQKVGDSLTNIEKVMKAQKEGGYIDLHQIKAFSAALKNLKEMEGKGKGLLAEVAGGLNTRVGRWAFTVNNFTSIGVSPYIDLTNLYLGTGTFSNAPRMHGVYYTSGGGSGGIDLSGLVALSTTTAPSGLETQSRELAKVIDALDSAAGVSLGTFTPEHIANALINYARGQGARDSEIINAVNQIVDAKQLIMDILSGNVFVKNNSNLTISGVAITEFTLSHGRSLSFISDKPLFNSIYFGVNVKYMLAYVAFMRQYLLKEQTLDFNGMDTVFKKHVSQSANFGLDLGVLWIGEKIPLKPRFGLLAKNINSPSFTQPTAAKDAGYANYVVEPQLRLGAAIRPFNWWLIASDIDITENKTAVEGHAARNVSLGNEFNVFNRPRLNLALRAGMLKNFAVQHSPLTYTAGLGLNLFHFVFELGGAISADRVLIEGGRAIPSRAMASMTLSLNF